MWTSLRTAAWLGWQIESNWASPALFALYSIVKPLTSAAILVVMFGMVTQGNFASTAFSYMYIGNAFYMYVGAIMAGMAQSVVDDRERFRTLKSMYVAPVSIPMYLIGRGVARFFTTSLSVLVTIGVRHRLPAAAGEPGRGAVGTVHRRRCASASRCWR